MVVKVEKQKEKERQKLSSLPESINVSVEEYNNWDPTEEEVPASSANSRKRKLSTSSSDSDVSRPSTNGGRTSQRSAANSARKLFSELI